MEVLMSAQFVAAEPQDKTPIMSNHSWVHVHSFYVLFFMLDSNVHSRLCTLH